MLRLVIVNAYGVVPVDFFIGKTGFRLSYLFFQPFRITQPSCAGKGNTCSEILGKDYLFDKILESNEHEVL